MRSRNAAPPPDLDPRDAELALLNSRIGAALNLIRVQLTKVGGNRTHANDLLDVRNVLDPRRSV